MVSKAIQTRLKKWTAVAASVAYLHVNAFSGALQASAQFFNNRKEAAQKARSGETLLASRRMIDGNTPFTQSRQILPLGNLPAMGDPAAAAKPQGVSAASR